MQRRACNLSRLDIALPTDMCESPIFGPPRITAITETYFTEISSAVQGLLAQHVLHFTARYEKLVHPAGDRYIYIFYRDDKWNDVRFRRGGAVHTLNGIAQRSHWPIDSAKSPNYNDRMRRTSRSTRAPTGSFTRRVSKLLLRSKTRGKTNLILTVESKYFEFQLSRTHTTSI